MYFCDFNNFNVIIICRNDTFCLLYLIKNVNLSCQISNYHIFNGWSLHLHTKELYLLTKVRINVIQQHDIIF